MTPIVHRCLLIGESYANQKIVDDRTVVLQMVRGGANVTLERGCLYDVYVEV